MICMEEMISLLYRRRSCRAFLDQDVEEKKIERLVEAALLSPTGRNLYPWEFIVVTKSEMLEKLSKAKEHGSELLAKAPLAIVVLADPQKTDVWIEDASIATITLQYMAEAMGLASCWVQIRNRYKDQDHQITSEAYIQELLTIPENLKVESIVAVGYRKETARPKAKEDLLTEKIYFGQYGDDGRSL